MKIYSFESLNSTNEYMKKNYTTFSEFDTVTAKTQTAGKGRRDNIWISSEGMALFTFLVKKRDFLAETEYIKLPLLAGFATIKGLNKIEPLNYKFKWTNDIYLSDKKLSGILIERIDDNFFIGIGININNTLSSEIKNIAISLSEVTGKEYNIIQIITSIINEFKILYNKFLKGSWQEILNEINNINYLKNQKINLKTGKNFLSGIAQNINYKGEIEVLANEKIYTFSIGEIIKERVAVSVNNGIYSAVTVYLLKEEGYDVIGVNILNKKFSSTNKFSPENICKCLKIKLEKIENTNKNIVENLSNIAQKYHTSYIALENKNLDDLNYHIPSDKQEYILLPLKKYNEKELEVFFEKINDYF